MNSIKTYLTIIVSVICFSLYSNEVDSLKILYTDAQTDSQRVELLLKITNKTWLFDNSDAIIFARRAHRLAAELPHQKALAESLYLLGKLTYARSEHDSALIYFQQGLQQYNLLDDAVGIGDCFIGIGDYYYFVDAYAAAEEYYLKAIESYRKVNKKTGIANTYISLGDLAYSVDNYVKASQYYQKAYPEYEEAGSVLGMATSINCMADIDYEQKQYTNASEGYRKAISMFNKVTDLLGIANCTKRLGDVFYNTMQYDSAFVYFNTSYSIYKRVSSKMGQAYSLRSIGMCYLKTNSVPDALLNFELAQNIFMEIGDKLGVGNTYYHFGEANYQLGNYTETRNNALKGFEIATEIGSPDLSLFTSDLLSKAYEKLGQYESAYHYEIINKQIKDTLNSSDNIRKITQLQMQFQFDQETKETQLAQMKKDLLQEDRLKRQKLYTYAGIFCGLLMLITATVFYRNYKQKQKNNIILEEKNDIIATKNKSLTDSIEYAKTLQNAILPQKEILSETFPNSFIYYNPKDIVSGDFYWFAKVQHHFVVTASDCTGHGVPGAFMSLLGNEYLHQVVNADQVILPKEAILKLDQKIKDSLHIHEQHKRAKDGMDLALCSINMDTLEMEFCGAYNPLYLVRNKELKIFDANKGSVGSLMTDDIFSHTIQLQKNDIIYMSSDGYLDQFGGDKGKKFMKNRFQQLLLDISEEPITQQGELLHKNMVNWIGDYKQVDDMLVIGIQI